MESWGFKDPRTALTIDVWLEHLPSPQFIACYRNYNDIAKSLQIRNNFPIEKGKKIAEEYYKRIANFLHRFYNQH